MFGIWGNDIGSFLAGFTVSFVGNSDKDCELEVDRLLAFSPTPKLVITFVINLIVLPLFVKLS